MLQEGYRSGVPGQQKKVSVIVSSGYVVGRLGELETTGRVQAFVRDSLRNRCIRVGPGKFLSQKHMLSKGLPQRCVLSPLLANVVLSDIFSFHVGLPREVRKTIFADDIRQWTSPHFNKNLVKFAGCPRLHPFPSRLRWTLPHTGKGNIHGVSR